jgi:site-specific DNA recombinase
VRQSAKRKTAVIYARISLDRAGAGLGIERQVEDCIALAKVRGLTVVATLTDNDVSAYSGRTRPNYRKLLSLIDAGGVDVVLAWHTDRLHRSPRELEEYISLSEAHHTDTVTVQTGELDLATASGRMVARMLGAAARHESEQKSERIRRARQQSAQAGHANGNLGYGYNDDRTINPAQAAILREAATRLLAGETMYAVTSDLNARGVPSPRNRPGGWRGGNLRGTVTRATIAGWREWRPGSLGAKGGYGLGEFLAEGSWTPILERSTVERLRAVLFDPARPAVRRPPENLLTGVLICGHCKHGLNGAGTPSRPSDKRRYRCIRQPGDSHCGRISILADPVEQLVSAAVLEVLAGTRLATARSAGPLDSAVAERELLDARQDRDELAAQRARGDITPGEWATMRRVLTERIERAEHAIATAGSGLAALTNVPSGRSARKWWAGATVTQRRIVVQALIQSVEIAPSRHPTPKFDPARVSEPIWRI